MARSIDDISTKSEMEHIRMRPRRYLGSYAHTTAAREIVDNATDEFVRGYSTFVKVTFHDDGSIEVQDDGRGLPVGYDSAINKNGIEKSLAMLRSGSNFGDSDSTAGTNGEGATTTNAISSRFDVAVYIGDKMYRQSFRKGEAGVFEGKDFDPGAKFTKKPGQKLKGVKSPKGSPKKGTIIRFLFDEDILPDDMLDRDEIIRRLHYTARLNPGLDITIVTPEGEQKFCDDSAGVKDVLTYNDENTSGIVEASGESTYNTTKTVKGEKQLVSKPVGFSVAFGMSDTPTVTSFVNAIYTPEDGSHATAALKAIGKAAVAKKVRGLKLSGGEQYPKPEDFAATVSVAINVSTPAPELVGQDKRKLNQRGLGNAVEREVERVVTAWAVSPANNDALTEWAELALERARTTRKMEALKNSGSSSKKKRASGGTLALPDDYVPSSRTGYKSGAELHLCEGKSAAGSVEAARNAEFQACYPLRGKQINSFNTPLGTEVPDSKTHNPRKKGDPITMRTNETFVAIERIIGSGVRENCIPKDSRFQRIIFSTDADPDGANIAAQLQCMFFFNFMPLIEAGMVYTAVPPLFVITTSDSNERWYAVDEADKDRVISEEINKDGKNRSVFVKRCKGLGEMNSDEFYDTVMNPDKRMLRKVNKSDFSYDALKMAFGDSAEARREFLAKMGELGVTKEVSED